MQSRFEEGGSDDSQADAEMKSRFASSNLDCISASASTRVLKNNNNNNVTTTSLLDNSACNMMNYDIVHSGVASRQNVTQINAAVN